jgi:hypothetical protein
MRVVSQGRVGQRPQVFVPVALRDSACRGDVDYSRSIVDASKLPR